MTGTMRSNTMMTITDYDEIGAVLRDPTTFSSGVMAPADPVLLGADPPVHARARRALVRALSPARIMALSADVEAIADDLVADVDRRRGGDLVADLAIPLPIQIMARIFGADEPDWSRFRRWAVAVIARGSGGAVDRADDELDRDLADLDEWLGGGSEERSGDGRGVIGLMKEGPEGLNQQDAASVAKLLIVAGTETTTHLIGSAAMELVYGNVGRMPARSVDIEAVIDSTLWRVPPVQRIYRVAARDAVIDGHRVETGTVVSLELERANAERWAARDVRIEGSPHLAFGAGPHRCPGAALAMMEATIALRSLTTRLPRLTPAEGRDAIPMARSGQLAGPARLLVAVANAV